MGQNARLPMHPRHSDTQRRYSQVQKEALSVIYGIQKFHHFFYGRKFILITDHKPLLALFNPQKGTPSMAANRLARWALTLSQYDYSIEYRRTSEHGNADALSRLPVREDVQFDKEQEAAHISTVCTIQTLSQQLNPTDAGILARPHTLGSLWDATNEAIGLLSSILATH